MTPSDSPGPKIRG